MSAEGRRKGLALSGRCVASGIRTPQAAARPAPLRGEPSERLPLTKPPLIGEVSAEGRRKGLALSGRCVASGIRTPQAAARPAPLRGEPSERLPLTKPPLSGEVSAKQTEGSCTFRQVRGSGKQNPSGRCAALAELRLAHHAARLGAALAFCDRGPCFVSLYPPQAALDSAAPKGEPFGGVKTPPYRAVERGRHSARQIAPQTPTGHIHAAPTICRKAGNQILPFPSAGDTIAAPYLYNDPHSRRFVGRGQDPAAGTSRHRSGSCPFFTKADAKKFQQKSNGVRFWAKVLWYFLSRKYRNRNKNKSPHPPAIRQGVGVYTFNILQG